MSEAELFVAPAPAEAAEAPAKVTAADIRAAMLRRWGAKSTNGRTAVLFEVGNATGFGRNRSADALVMWCWPSDGLELHGAEIKVSRSDWQRERLQPKKADDIAKYCDRWWLITGPGVVRDVEELPPAWGWRVFDGKAWRTEKEATITEAAPIDRTFLGSVLRNAGRLSEGAVERARQEAADGLEAEVERRVAERLRSRTPEATSKLLKVVEEFEAATGITLHEGDTWRWMSGEGARVGRIVGALKASGFDGSGWQTGALAQLVQNMLSARKVFDEVEAAARSVGAEMGLPLPDPAEAPRRRKAKP